MIVALIIIVFEALTLNWIARQFKGFEWSDVISFLGAGHKLEALPKPGLAVLSLLIWPFNFYFWNAGERLVVVVSNIVLVIVSIYFKAHAVTVALFGSYIIVLASLKYPIFIGRLLSLLIVFLILFSPSLLKPLTSVDSIEGLIKNQKLMDIPSSFINRLHIWQFSIEKISEKPLLGWGMKTSKVIPGASDNRKISVPGSLRKPNETRYILTNLPLHPHNHSL
ncbi:MAG: O-antigen ligase family protein, partial [Pseudomonadota bacterium]|nr:O-antigen ligase family protein [Pseudomonadota bacterium]